MQPANGDTSRKATLCDGGEIVPVAEMAGVLFVLLRDCTLALWTE